jgi:hypothetical protein
MSHWIAVGIFTILGTSSSLPTSCRRRRAARCRSSSARAWSSVRSAAR